METDAQESNPQNDAVITSFCEITSASKQEASFFLESHNWDLDAAVSTFLDNTSAAADADAPATFTAPATAVTNAIPLSPSPSDSPNYSPSQSPSRSRSPSPTPSRAPYQLRSKRAASGKDDAKPPAASRPRGITTLSDLNRPAMGGSDSDSDEPNEYYTGGEKSGMLVQDPTKGNDVDSIFSKARQLAAAQGPIDHHHHPSSSSRSFSGTARLLTGETVPTAATQPPESVTHTITFWRNGFSVDDGPLRRLDDPANAPFLESIKNSECPKELEPADRKTEVHVNMMRRDEEYPEPAKQRASFRGVGRTLGGTSSTSEPTAAAPPQLRGAPSPLIGLTVDESLPSTSIQLRLADGTRMVSRFNFHHTVGDIHAFIDASRPDGARSYRLQTMGFPPKQLTDLDQTIEQAGVANSVIIQTL